MAASRVLTPVSMAPTECPFCKSVTISATGQKVTASIYWRCENCGQIWNPGRQRPRNDFEFPRR